MDFQGQNSSRNCNQTLRVKLGARGCIGVLMAKMGFRLCIRVSGVKMGSIGCIRVKGSNWIPEVVFVFQLSKLFQRMHFLKSNKETCNIKFARQPYIVAN